MSVLSPTVDAIRDAARVIREGGLVVLPTETVYGLGCDALNPEAVAKVFEAKGRPQDNPLIVHISGFDQLGTVAASWPPLAEKLAAQFWPGPMTLVLPKLDRVPVVTTAGLDTVAVRVPSHPVMRAVIELAKRPIAAPSANVFMGLSPTKAEDIDPEILVEAEFVLDGGPCELGLESTVVDLSDGGPRILRPGAVSRADIQALVGQPLGHIPPGGVRRSPGQHLRHYAPRSGLRLVSELEPDAPGLTFGEPANDSQVRMPADPKAYGAVLYSALRRLDVSGKGTIQVESPPDRPEWEAVMDRLRKASATLF